ncbi:MAG: hypothetical protein P8J87_10265 [Verrucomicrobiales bacterium]|nr:hypothetical protein [Verrucomicrobiales bacterium]
MTVDPGGRRPRGRWLKRGFWGLVCGLLGVVPAVNVVLMLPAVKSRVEGKLAVVAGSPVTAGSIRYWPWSGVTMRELVVAGGGRIPGGVSVAVEAVVVEVALGSVFSDDIEVPLVRVVRPVVEIEWRKAEPAVVAAVRPAEERPKVEVVPPRVAEPEEPREAPVVVVAREGAGNTSGEGEAARPAEVKRERGRQLVLGVVEVLEGRVAVKREGRQEALLEVEGIELETDLSDRGDGDSGRGMTGTCAIGAIEAGGRLKVEDVAGEVVIGGGVVRLKGVNAKFGGGVVEGEAAMSPGAGGLPFELSVKAKGIDLGVLTAAGVEGLEGLEGYRFGGVLEGEANLSGYGMAAASWRGQGGVKIAELGISGGGTAVELKPVEVSGTLRDGWMNLDRFYAHSDALALRASGGGWADGRIAVNLRVFVDREVAKAVTKKLEVLGGGVSSGVRELEGTHYAYRDVAVRGTLGNPLLVLWDGQRSVRPGDFLRCFTPGADPVEPFVAE